MPHPDDQTITPLAVEGTVVATNGCYELLDYDAPADILPDAGVNNGLVAVGSSGAIILTTFTYGPVALRLEIHDAAPPVTRDHWEVVVEVDQHTPSGTVSINSPASGTEPGFPPCQAQPDSWYTIRARARGRKNTANVDSLPGEAVEQHLIQLWPRTTAHDPAEAWDPTHRPYRVLITTEAV